MKLTFVPPFPGLLSSDDITSWSGSAWLAGVHQPPGAEDLPVQRTARSLRISSPHSGRLGDPQGPERQALLLQPRHGRAYLEAAAYPRHRQQRQKRQPGRDGEWGERVWRIPPNQFEDVGSSRFVCTDDATSQVLLLSCYQDNDNRLCNCGDIRFYSELLFF